MSIPYDAPYGTNISSPGGHQRYLNYTSHTGSPPILTFNNDEVVELFGTYGVPGDGTFVPTAMEVREGSGEDARRLFLLGEDKLQYKVLKFAGLDSTKDGTDEDISMS